ncbi:outer membrane protein assembly factor BamE [Alteraurantiacibacter aquimixticola]|uniref:Outer membrane protein assembly factor BamE n=1 Tax=Alteraurantiacibacter aquimixticola TaxID=2489173 RepID=A0A4T3EYR2_9SPHN|nr:outer membrane protein assembly factor BamE [Alteraurantiacibacter aquimixticola]TIX49661.1 outer membrane protein assembly factor BamE [Alteraurantiacibacter aquimixticola]
MHATMRIAAVLGALALVTGCSSIRNSRGYLVDEVLVASVQPGIDNRESVEQTLGRPTLTSQFGEPVWYYISSRTAQAPFTTPRINAHSVLAIRFDEAGNVATAERTGMDKVVRLDPDGDATPTLGRDRSLLQDLFGNIGTVGAPGTGAR